MRTFYLNNRARNAKDIYLFVSSSAPKKSQAVRAIHMDNFQGSNTTVSLLQCHQIPRYKAKAKVLVLDDLESIVQKR